MLIRHDCVGPGDIPYKMKSGNLKLEPTCSATGTVEYMAELGTGASDPIGRAWELIAAHRESLAAHGQRVATVSFVITQDSVAIPPHGDARAIGIRYGDFYSRDLVVLTVCVIDKLSKTLHDLRIGEHRRRELIGAAAQVPISL